MDSYVVTALVLQNHELVESLAEVGRLNITQYRVLLKAHELGERARVGDVAASLSLPQNVTSQSADRLESLGLVERVADASDRRATVLLVTPEGTSRVEEVDRTISAHVNHLWSQLSPYLALLVQGVIRALGATQEGAPPVLDTASIPSAYLTTIARAHQSVIRLLETTVSASLTECRIVQRTTELGGRARIADLSASLLLRSNTLAAAADRLESRGWAKRVRDAESLSAVHLEITPAGAAAAETIQSTLDFFMQERWLRHLSAAEQVPAYDASRLLVETRQKKRRRAARRCSEEGSA